MTNSVHNLTAIKLRIILIISVLVLLVLAGVAFWFFRGYLVSYANDVKQASSEASRSDAEIARLQNIEKILKDDEVAVNRAQKIVAESQYYKYQDQIITDITTYAEQSGITVTGFTFSEDTQQPGTSPEADPTLPPGLKSTTVLVSVVSPVSYSSIMRFIHAIELNLTKMQLTGIRLVNSLAQDNDSPSITTSGLQLEVYTR